VAKIAESTSRQGTKAQAVLAWIKSHPVLSLIVTLALILRAANLLWGVPLTFDVGSYHGDEAKCWSSAANFPEVYLASTNYLYGTAVQYTVGLLMWPAKAVMVYARGQDVEFQLATIVVFRAVNVVLGAATVAIVYFLGRRLRSERAGLIAAALLALAFGPTLHAALTTLDVPMAFLLAASALSALRAQEQLETRAFVWLGVVLGMMCGTKVTGVLYAAIVVGWLALSLLVVPTAAGRETADSSRRWSWLILAAAVTLGVFVITSPHIFLGWSDYLKFMQSQKQQWYDKAAHSPAAIGAAWWRATSDAIGAPTVLLGLAGAALVKRESLRVRSLLFLLVISTYAFWMGYLVPRFVIPVAPLWCVLAAATCDRLLSAPQPLARGAGWCALVAAVGWSTVFTGLGVAQKWNDPRTQAARYISAHVPAGASIGIATDHGDQWQHHGWRYPAIDFGHYRDVYFVDLPDFVVVSSYEMDTMQKAAVSPKLLPGDKWDPRFRDEWYLSQPPPPEVFAFYRELLAGKTYELAAEFLSGTHMPFDGACPAVFIYQRKATVPTPPRVGTD
jgi:asparagine N-glycosylation enzyme membrane subunit Stt3